MENYQNQTNILRALAYPVCCKSWKHWICKPASVSELMVLTSRNQANIYQHLTLLRQNGLVYLTLGKPVKTHFSPGSKGGHSAIQAQMESYSL